MKLSAFQFAFPQELVAVEPSEPRSAARMMVIEREADSLSHATFAQLSNYLKSGDVLVLNETTVLPARFFAQRKTGAKLEGLYLKANSNSISVWLKGKVTEGESILIHGLGELRVLKRLEKDAELACDPTAFIAHLKAQGLPPIPPYIRSEREARGLAPESESDARVYQTVFAATSDKHSVASPTASLHFDEGLLNLLHAKGVQIEKISLAVGAGTFAPVMVENLDDHEIHLEHCSIAPQVWNRIQIAKKEGRRIIAVGTTAMRTLESAAIRASLGERVDDFWTKLFIRPPFTFKVVDGLVTNFHWPDSTLMVLVATFLEAQNGVCKSELHHAWRTYYDLSIRERYRLFSYGDGMLIL